MQRMSNAPTLLLATVAMLMMLRCVVWWLFCCSRLILLCSARATMRSCGQQVQVTSLRCACWWSQKLTCLRITREFAREGVCCLQLLAPTAS